ncbi:target of Sbf [Orbilia oligospora]|uniref:glucan endo-1,3-beta-D-glucosidase n=1 Tax=Orbilia oligospora TaxID=2813651 RepID=A0A7C8NP46_ORBOL|nr:target of Sbf [Orbilia oligospora]KAF3113997.1 target of Sbf [Orbilia oligospora]KAF3128846.1 target of Sbf [Orbilia oligospora]KAF3134106.1 target of Sbf [Orbilia oligospora]
MPFGKTVFLGAILAMGRMSEAKQVINNVWYCNEVNKMQYTNVGCSGTFKTPSIMSDNSGSCSVDYAERTYSGPLAPLNEQITFHLRGPLKLYNFAAYYIDNTPEDEEEDIPEGYQKREEAPHKHRRFEHVHHHKRKLNVKTEVVEEVVTLTQYVDAPAPTTSTTSTTSKVVAPSAVVANAYKAHGKSSKPKKPANGDLWKRAGFYDSGKQILEGVTFLNNKGGIGSGKWTSCFGNSLSHMSADGKDGSATPQILADNTLFGVNEEFSIWTNQTCDGTCGYAYGDDVCYRGWDGDNKVFVFKFTMPPAHTDDSNIYGNSNMPAIWSLNSLIGRTQQYPADKNWSCWDSGCGEFDIWEVLYPQAPACEYMTSTLHSAQGNPGTGKGGGGTCDYFKRPTDTTFTGMVSYLSDGTITIQKLDDDFDFPEYITTDIIKKGFSADMPSFKVSS